MIVASNPAVFIPLFVAFWCAVCLTLSIASGWRTLAQFYRASRPFTGQRLHLRTASFGSVGYNGCITLGANAEGLFVSVLLPFRLGHPPLFIRWSEIENVGQSRQLFVSVVRLRFKRAPNVTFGIFRGTAEAIVKQANGYFRLASS